MLFKLKNIILDEFIGYNKSDYEIYLCSCLICNKQTERCFDNLYSYIDDYYCDCSFQNTAYFPENRLYRRKCLSCLRIKHLMKTSYKNPRLKHFIDENSKICKSCLKNNYTLPDKRIKIINRLMFLGATLEYVGNQLGITRERVRQLCLKYNIICPTAPKQSELNKKIAINLRQRMRLAWRVAQLEALKSTTTLVPHIKKKAGSAVKDLGCTIDEFIKHTENLFYDNPETGEKMTWDNHGLFGWHFDHILPLSRFDLTDREQLLQAVHYTNIQPLWAKDNIRKGNKISFL